MRPNRIVLKLSLSHFCVDAYGSMPGALIPFLYTAHNLSFTEAGILAGTLILSGALLQPLYGYLSDRWNSRAFTAFGPAISGFFICILGVTSSYSLMLIFVFFAGVGIAAFHPQGTALVSKSSKKNPAVQLSFFITFGMLGYAIGPMTMGSLVAFAGLRWSILAAIPGLLVTLYVWTTDPLPVSKGMVTQHQEVFRSLRLNFRPLFLLFSLVIIKSSLQMAFVVFLPLFLVLRGYSEVSASQILTLFLLVGALSAFLGGILTDRIGGKSVLLISMSGLTPSFLCFLATEGRISIMFCIVGAGFLLMNSPVNIAMAQRLVPQGTGTVSALMMGFAWGIGGMSVPIIGWTSDTIGMTWSFLFLSLLGLPGLILALCLPGKAGGISGVRELV